MNYLNYTRTAILVLTLIVTFGCEDDPDNEGNHLPTVKIISGDQVVNQGETVNLSATAIDVDGDSLTYFWTIKNKPNGSDAQINNSRRKSASFVPDETGDYIVTFKANDGLSDSDIKTARVRVTSDGVLTEKKLWDIDLKFDAHPNVADDRYYNAQEKWHWKKVKFASINDTVYSGATAEELYNSGAFYFPYMDNEVKILGHTTPYTEHGIEMTYTNEGKYCMDDIQKLIRDYLVETMTHGLEEVADDLDTRYGVTDLVENCTMRLGSEVSGAGAIYMGLSSSNVDNLLKHKSFTFQESRVWGNMQGTSTIIIEFKPAK